MINVEPISPYTIVEENGLYGITDNQGNLVVPCVMDYICNEIDEEVGLIILEVIPILLYISNT